ncbi:GATA zinc finger domain-containing protein 14-like [Prorops nasuta]|uniref:GATA zinc finger domain-containing protein 14-like n=1 Tax=Prorops nasuta TaxID=863751 RepID=UPI0034CE730A
MNTPKNYLPLLLAVVLWSCVLGLQRPPPRYSQQYMPETSFTCRNKIVGSYYADPETDCQLFHVCVSVAGSIQDYKFLCPNDTAFDQESQTCADWYDVDCEAATLYYASDNFDLYRIGSGLESLHYDSIRSDAEPQDHLQRSESSDPVRSSANTLNRVQPSNNYQTSANNNNNNNNRDILRGSSSGNFYNNRQNGKEDDYESEKSYKDDVTENKKKPGIRKISRKQQYSGVNSNNYSPSTSTPAPVVASNNQNAYSPTYYNNYNNHRTAEQQQGKGQTTQKYTSAPASSTYRPTTNYQDTYSTYHAPVTTARTTVYHSYNTNGNGNNQQYVQSTTARPLNYNAKNNYQPYTGQYTQSTTIQPTTNYQANDFNNYQQRNYNNIQRTSSSTVYQTTTLAPVYYDTNSYYNNNNNNNGQYRHSSGSSTRQEPSQTTAKYFPNYTGSTGYVPTTYSPVTKKFPTVDNSVAQTSTRNNDRYNSQTTDNGQQYYEKNSQPARTSTAQYYDSTKAPKKATQYNNYDSSNTGKYYVESSTANYDFGRSSAAIGFSPSSINHLAETPRTTTPVPRRAVSATTYNPTNFNTNTQQRSSPNPTTPRATTYVSGSARPFTSTTRFLDNTTAKPKSGKKNDYDYAYYDNAAPLEYDALEDAGNKESSKITRN